MDLYLVLGLILVAALAAWLFVAARRRSARAAPPEPWPDTRPRERELERLAAQRAGTDFTEDTAPAVLSMPVGLEDLDAKAAARSGSTRRTH